MLHFFDSSVIFSFEDSTGLASWAKGEKDNTERKINNIDFFILPPEHGIHEHLNQNQNGCANFFLFFCDEHHTILSATKSIVILSFSATEKTEKIV